MSLTKRKKIDKPKSCILQGKMNLNTEESKMFWPEMRWKMSLKSLKIKMLMAK